MTFFNTTSHLGLTVQKAWLAVAGASGEVLLFYQRGGGGTVNSSTRLDFDDGFSYRHVS